MHWSRRLRSRLRAFRDRAAVTERTAWRFLGLLSYEAERGADLSLHRRLAYLRRGFCSRAATHYNREPDGLDDYLPDFTGTTGLLDINRETVAATNHKAITDGLLRDRHADHLPEVYGVLTSISPEADTSQATPDGSRPTTDTVKRTVINPKTGRRIDTDPAAWLTRSIADHGSLVIKPAVASGGRGFRLVEQADDVVGQVEDMVGQVDDGNDPPTDTPVRVNGTRTTTGSLLADLASDSTLLVTAAVQQADYAASIYDGATNTIRLLTLRDPETDESFVAAAVHRFGTAETAPVDSWNTGGLVAAIDDETGTLGSAVRRETQPDRRGVEWTKTHPDSGARITGTEVERWDELREAATSMADALWCRPLIAWDLVVTPNGIRVIEANSNPAIDMLQVHKPLLAEPRSRRVFAHHGVIETSRTD